jgi:hypothetical protein
MEPRTFKCEDCGILVIVYQTHANDQNLCAECTWLRDIEDVDDRKALREFLRRNDF